MSSDVKQTEKDNSIDFSVLAIRFNGLLQDIALLRPYLSQDKLKKIEAQVKKVRQALTDQRSHITEELGVLAKISDDFFSDELLTTIYDHDTVVSEVNTLCNAAKENLPAHFHFAVKAISHHAKQQFLIASTQEKASNDARQQSIITATQQAIETVQSIHNTNHNTHPVHAPANTKDITVISERYISLVKASMSAKCLFGKSNKQLQLQQCLEQIRVIRALKTIFPSDKRSTACKMIVRAARKIAHTQRFKIHIAHKTTHSGVKADFLIKQDGFRMLADDDDLKRAIVAFMTDIADDNTNVMCALLGASKQETAPTDDKQKANDKKNCSPTTDFIDGNRLHEKMVATLRSLKQQDRTVYRKLKDNIFDYCGPGTGKTAFCVTLCQSAFIDIAQDDKSNRSRKHPR